MDKQNEFNQSVARKITHLTNLAADFPTTSEEWQRLNTKATTLELNAVLVNTFLNGIIGTFNAKANQAKATIIALRNYVETATERIYEADPRLSNPGFRMQVVQLGGQREGYNLLLDVIEQELLR